MTLFVFSTKDGWVTIMYDGIDAVGIDKQVLIKVVTECRPSLKSKGLVY